MQSRLRSTSLLLALIALASGAFAQTTLHTISIGYAWDTRSIGDVDGDGVDDFAAGCPGTYQLTCNGGAGVVHVYSGRTGAELYWRSSPPSASNFDAFGWSIDRVGDTNGDGISDFVVGAPLWSSTASCGEGRAFICSGADGAVLQTLTGLAGQQGSYTQFGRCVAGVGDVNADGVPDVAVASEYGINLNGVQSGYVCVFSGADGSVLHVLNGNWNGERFGTACAAAGDVNGDGVPDILVGSPYYYYATGPGAVRIYSGYDGLLLRFVTGVAPPPQAITIGFGVASLGDVNGDGVPDFVTGATPSYGSNGARVYSGASGGLLFSVAAQPTFNAYGGVEPFPHPVAGLGDVNGDGTPDIITATTSGAVVYSGGNGAQIFTRTLPSDCASVGPASDLNHDGYADFLCNAWNAGTTIANVVLMSCPVPATYCTGKLNSVGCLPSMASSGVMSLSVGNDDFHAYSQSSLNNTNGMLLWSVGPNAVPFFGGTLCVAPPIMRTGLQNSGGSATGIDCTGSFSFHFSRAYASSVGVTPGERIYCQYWSRDPGYSPPNNVSLTNGLSFTVCP